MLNEYALIPDIFDRGAYSDPALIEVCLPHLKEPLLQEALVRDLYDGYWRNYCLANAGTLHRLTKEILRKLISGNRLRLWPKSAAPQPATPLDWCNEALDGRTGGLPTGVIAAHSTKQHFPSRNEVASIEKLTGTAWWHRRSPSLTVTRTTASYLGALGRVLSQANSLMFIDPNLDPSSNNYREFSQLLLPLASRPLKPKVEIHRSFCRGDGPARTFPTEADWKGSFSSLSAVLRPSGLSVELFLWEDFHERYLITDVIGISVPAGFDVTAKPDDWSTWGRLGREDRDRFQRMFDPAARNRRLYWRIPLA